MKYIITITVGLFILLMQDANAEQSSVNAIDSFVVHRKIDTIKKAAALTKDNISINSDSIGLLQHFIVEKKNPSGLLDKLTPWVSFAGFFISALGFFFAARAFYKNIKNRNLAFLAELDKMLINNPELWEFYDENCGHYCAHGHITIDKSKIEIKGPESFNIKDANDVKISNVEDSESIIIIDGKEKTITKGGHLTINGDCECQIPSKSNIKITQIQSSKITFKNEDSKKLEGKLMAFTYYKLNHFEMILLESNNKDWKGYIKYCLDKSERMRSLVCEITKNEHPGLYGEKTVERLTKIYKEYEDEKTKKGEIIAPCLGK